MSSEGGRGTNSHLPAFARAGAAEPAVEMVIMGGGAALLNPWQRQTYAVMTSAPEPEWRPAPRRTVLPY